MEHIEIRNNAHLQKIVRKRKIFLYVDTVRVAITYKAATEMLWELKASNVGLRKLMCIAEMEHSVWLQICKPQ